MPSVRGRIKVVSPLPGFAGTCVQLCGGAGWVPFYAASETAQQPSGPSQARDINIFKRNNVKWSKVVISTPQGLKTVRCKKCQNSLNIQNILLIFHCNVLIIFNIIIIFWIFQNIHTNLLYYETSCLFFVRRGVLFPKGRWTTRGSASERSVQSPQNVF